MNYFENQLPQPQNNFTKPPIPTDKKWKKAVIFDSTMLNMETAEIKIPEDWTSNSQVIWHYMDHPTMYQFKAENLEKTETLSMGSANMKLMDFINLWEQQNIHLYNSPTIHPLDPENILSSMLMPSMEKQGASDINFIKKESQPIQSRYYMYGSAYKLFTVAEYTKNGEQYYECVHTECDYLAMGDMLFFRSFSASSPSSVNNSETLENILTYFASTYKENEKYNKIFQDAAKQEAKHQNQLAQMVQKNNQETFENQQKTNEQIYKSQHENLATWTKIITGK